MFRSNDAAQEFIFMVSAPVSTNGTLNMNVEKWEFVLTQSVAPSVHLPHSYM